MSWKAQVVLAVALPLLAACSSAIDQNGGSTAATSQSAASPDDGCKDFPAPLYPSKTSCSCSQSGDRYTASIETTDSVSQVTQYYQTRVQGDGWTPDPEPLISPKHTVVTIKKDPGHAVISTFTGSDGQGCSFQINVFPKGNSH